jgi:Pyridoxamine 5'-phosphate oxidase
MADVIPEKCRERFVKPAFAHLATLMPDGRPQVTPVWCAFDGRYIHINTAFGRQHRCSVAALHRQALSVAAAR